MGEKKVLLGVCGSIAAYKSIEIARKLISKNISVYTVMTKSATQFVNPLILESLTNNPVFIDMFEGREKKESHISLTDIIDLILIAPATANIIGKIANGIADDMLTTIVISSKSPVALAPAMNERMWLNPIVQENVEKLKKNNYYFIGPEYGELASGEKGFGRLADVEKIVSETLKLLESNVK